MLLTPHFTLEELCFTSYKSYKDLNLKEAQKQMGRMYQLAGFAERVREIIGKPLIITSGFRCVKLNNAVKGAACSQHLYAEAIDFKVTGMTPLQIICELMTSDLKFQQLIAEHSGSSAWTHIGIGSKQEVLTYRNGVYTKIGEVKQ